MRNKIQIKQQEEKQHLRYFKHIFQEFPAGKIAKSESPDFMLQLSRHRFLGLELTKLFLNRDGEQTHFVPHFEAQKTALLSRTKELFESGNGQMIMAHFKFSEYFEEVNFDLELMADELLSLLESNIPDSEFRHFFYRKLRREHLPDWLDSISIIHHPDDTMANWISCEQIIPAENFVESIQRAIESKQEKMQLYRKNRYDEYWLLIVADCLNCATHFNIPNFLDHQTYVSDFHRIFLFELFEQKIYYLK